MNTMFPMLLVWAFLGSFLLGFAKASRWQTVLVSLIVVWCLRVGPTEIDLVMTGTREAYAWFAFFSAAILFPAFAIAVIGTGLGAMLHSVVFPVEEIENEEMPEETLEQTPE
jgi:hypothetical protein